MKEATFSRLVDRCDPDFLRRRILRQRQHTALQFKGGFKVYWEKPRLFSAYSEIPTSYYRTNAYWSQKYSEV